MNKVIPQTFFNQQTLTVAKQLLGKFLVRKIGRQTIALMITEVEAYDGPLDRASHASRGITPRTKVMFGRAGVFYVYFTYGMHWMLNVVTGNIGYPAAVLIRGGISYNLKTGKPIYVTGPARLTKFLHVNGRLNTLPAIKKTNLWLEDRGIRIKSAEISADKRIGVDYAGMWAKKLYNFQLTPKALKKFIAA